MTLYKNNSNKKEKSHQYWHQTKVDTCAYIQIVNGTPQAVAAFKKPQSRIDHSAPF